MDVESCSKTCAIASARPDTAVYPCAVTTYHESRRALGLESVCTHAPPTRGAPWPLEAGLLVKVVRSQTGRQLTHVPPGHVRVRGGRFCLALLGQRPLAINGRLGSLTMVRA